MKIIFSGKRNLRLSEHIVFQHIVAAQFQFHAGSVSFQKVLRIVLTGKAEFLNNCNCYIQSCKKSVSLSVLPVQRYASYESSVHFFIYTHI